jgi:hypothetical protein
MAARFPSLTRRHHVHLPGSLRSVLAATAGFAVVLATVGWWRFAVGPPSTHADPGTVVFLGILLLGVLCVAVEYAAIAGTRHQQRSSDDEAPGGRRWRDRTLAAARGLAELVLDMVAGVGMAVGVALVLVAIVGLGLRAMR